MTVSTLVDSHCHINFEPLNTEVNRVLADARRNEVAHMLCVSVNLEDYPQVYQLAEAFENVFASVGVHPNEREGKEPTVEELATLAEDRLVVAIGETGLDYYRSEGDLSWQQNRFRTHIRAAREAGKPIIVHMRDAAADTLKIMEEESADEVGGVMHCYVEDWPTAQRSLDLGFYISFSGIVTFNSAKTLREVAKRVPVDRILVETDAPYLAPVPFRGKINEPAYVRHVAESLSDLRGQEYDGFAQATTENFFRLFQHAHPVAA